MFYQLGVSVRALVIKRAALVMRSVQMKKYERETLIFIQALNEGWSAGLAQKKTGLRKLEFNEMLINNKKARESYLKYCDQKRTPHGRRFVLKLIRANLIS